MVANTLSPRRRKSDRAVPVQTIGDADLRWALKAGLEDFNAMRGDLVFAGLLYTLIGIGAAVMVTSGALLPFFFPVVAGVGLLGPLAAVGFYELARRREAGETNNWSHFLDALRSPSADDIGIVAGLLLTIFAGWLFAAAALYALLFGFVVPDNVVEFARMVLTTPRGWALIVLGSGVGAFLGWLVMMVSVVAMPMLVDRDASAAQAVRTSIAAVRANRGAMLRWGMIVTALLVAASVPLFIGLAVVLPWLGYATWHLYTRLVDRTKLPGRPRR